MPYRWDHTDCPGPSRRGAAHQARAQQQRHPEPDEHSDTVPVSDGVAEPRCRAGQQGGEAPIRENVVDSRLSNARTATEAMPIASPSANCGAAPCRSREARG